MSSKIRVAVAGVGSCASALIQGIEFYLQNPEIKAGVMYDNIGGYRLSDIEFVVGFDVDDRKVGGYLRDAIYQLPNCNMKVVDKISDRVIPEGAVVFCGPTMDGIPNHMRELPSAITFVEAGPEFARIDSEDYMDILNQYNVDVLLNYMPVGSDKASAFYIENALKAGVSVVNCMPSYISTEEAMRLEALAIENKATIVGSDMRSSWGASRLSEVLQGAMMDAGLDIVVHTQENKASFMTQGDVYDGYGRSANTDFVNMADRSRLHSKHISKENVLNGQVAVRDQTSEGKTLYAGPSLTVFQKPGGKYRGTDNKIANVEMLAFGWAGARYELTARLSVQDSPNSAAIVADAIRFCRVAREESVVGYLRGPSAYSQKTPPVQMKSADSKFECDALARRVITPIVEKQLEKNSPDVNDLDYTFQKSVSDYE